MKKTILNLKTSKREEILDITRMISNAITIDNGMITVTIPHTSAGITINENYDYDVKIDFIFSLNKISPNYKSFRHMEGNSDSHIKASLVGRSETIAVIDGKLDLGQWEGIWFCEFDGARDRFIWIYQ